MSGAKHTPGPWMVLPSVTPTQFVILTENGPRKDIACTYGFEGDPREANARLIAAAPELLAVAQEALRIDKARLILADGTDDNGQPFTEAQRSDAKAFLANRSAAWLHEAVAAIDKATGNPA